MQPTRISRKLKELRGRKGVGLKKAAPHLGVSYTYLSKIENDKATPSTDLLSRLASYYGADEDELLLMAERIPEDLKLILRDHPVRAAEVLRQLLENDGRS